MSTRTQQASEGLRHLMDPVFQWVVKSGKPGTCRRQAQFTETIWNADDSVINPRLQSREDLFIDLEQCRYFLYRVF